MPMFMWDVVDPAPGEPVAPHQRLSIALGTLVIVVGYHLARAFAPRSTSGAILTLGDEEDGDGPERG